MATIKNIGVKCDSRSQARDLAKTTGGKLVDLAKRWDHFAESQIACQKLGIPVQTTRWIVLTEKRLDLVSGKGMLTAIKHAQTVSKGREIRCNGRQVSITSKRGALAMTATIDRYNAAHA